MIGLLFVILALATFALKAAALIDAALQKEAAFPAADKQSKMVWLGILGAATGLQLLMGPANLFGVGFLGGIINLAGIVAAIVYFVDVRPAVRSLGRGSSSDGPYGAW
jgi:hypothetical protein